MLASVDAELAELACRNCAYAPELFYIKSFDEVEGFVGVNDAETVWFAIIGGDFGEEFVVRDSGRGNKVEFGADALFDFAGNINGEFDAWLIVGNIEECFIERNGLDKVGVGVEDFVDLGRYLFVDLHATWYEDEVGAEALCFDGRHRRTDTETARLVAGSRYDTAHIAVAYSNGFALQLRVVALFHRGIEGVHVDMYNFAVHFTCKVNYFYLFLVPFY